LPRQQFLKPPSGVARAEVIAPQFFMELNVVMDEPATAFDVRFRGE
jgi:ABC-type taurine transport system ATPase subunit